MSREMISLTEAARRLKLSYAITHGLVLRGVLDGERFGGHYFVTERSVLEFLAERSTPATSGGR